jgi:hypothetical protein
MLALPINRVRAAAATPVILLTASEARTIDFYEIQIYTTETAAPGTLELELHSSSVTTATGKRLTKI